MAENQISKNQIVEIEVIDDNNLSFFFDVTNNRSTSASKEAASAKIEIKKDAYMRLFDGVSTFEVEASNGNLKISGDFAIIREFGKSLRENSKVN